MRYKQPKDYDKKIVLRKNNAIGYVYFLDKDHPLASKITYVVYYHRHVASVMIGRWISSKEHIHHKNHNREDNRRSNIEVLSRAEHGKKHRKYADHKCNSCAKIIMWSRIHCSNECRYKGQTKLKIAKNKLSKLVWEYPLTRIGQMFGVSGNCVKKRCKKLGITRPPIGYWAKRTKVSE